MKICNNCGIEKDENHFYKNRNVCKTCRANAWKNNPKRKELEKQYRLKNKEQEKNRNKKYHEEHKEEISKRKKEYQQSNKVKERYIILKDKRNENARKRYKERIENDPLFKLSHRLKTNIRKSLKKYSYTKSSKTYQIVGCSFEKLKQHLECQFKSWMNWDNYGKYNGEKNYGWDIDHIIPLSSAKSEKELLKLLHYTNLQPLCSYQNRYIKRNISNESFSNTGRC